MYRLYGNTLRGWELINAKPTLEEIRFIADLVKQDCNYESVMVIGTINGADTKIFQEACQFDLDHIQLKRKTKKKFRNM